MDRYDAQQALDDLRDDAQLPHPVRVRDMILRLRLDAVAALDINREFQEYLAHYGETELRARSLLEKLVTQAPKAS
jgi:hypothetical protein